VIDRLRAGWLNLILRVAAGTRSVLVSDVVQHFVTCVTTGTKLGQVVSVIAGDKFPDNPEQALSGIDQLIANPTRFLSGNVVGEQVGYI
jgi:hypothetical protein